MESVLLETVDQPEAQRQFGADDGEVDALVSGQCGETLDVSHRSINGAGMLSDSRVSWHGQESSDPGITREAAHQGVFARPGSDDKNSHVMSMLEGLAELRFGNAGERGFR